MTLLTSEPLTCPICDSDNVLPHPPDMEQCQVCGEVWYEDDDPAFDEYVLAEGKDDILF